MADGEIIGYSVASFICALFVLEFGADKFIDHTTIVAKRTGIPQGVIALLTAGAEWEELAVVVISIVRSRSSLALGNIVGSTISNILGAFSLGLLFHKNGDRQSFDKSSKIYSALLLVLTALIAVLVGFGDGIMWRVVGGLLIGFFLVYVVSIAWTIYRGLLSAPEVSDSDSSDSEDDHSDNGVIRDGNARASVSGIDIEPEQNGPAEDDMDPHLTANNCGSTVGAELSSTERTPLIRTHRTSSSLVAVDTHTLNRPRRPKQHSLTYHAALLILGILAVILSAYVLSHAASTLVSELGISDIVFGVVILSIATTIPEKFIAVVSGFRGQMGIMVASTVGSNIFLLTLCIGVLWVITGGNYDEGSVNPIEIGVMLGSAVVLNLTVWTGMKWARLMGGVMLGAYIAFLALEFTVIRQV